MVKHEEKTRKSFIIIIIISICIFVILSYFLFVINDIIKIELKIKKENILILENLKNDFNELEKEEQSLLDEISALKNIDEINKSVKNEVFALASKLEARIRSGTTNYKIAYLTFDDGPYYLTNSFLNILDKYEVKATFFTIGFDKERCYDNRTQDCSNMYKKIVNKGHTIANHTYSHGIFNGLYKDAETFIQDLKIQENFIKTKTGVTTNIMRFPGGSAQAKNLKNSIIAKLKENNYGWVDWTALNGDGGYIPNKTLAWNRFVNSIDEDIEVVLFHDYNYVTLSMLEDAIIYLQKNNYILLPLFYDSVMINK